MSQERVSGFPEKGADLRGSPGNFQRSPGNFRGSLGNFWGTSGLLLLSTVRELPGKSPKNFRGSSGNFRGLSSTFDWGVHLRKKIALSLKRHLFPHGSDAKMLAQGFLDLVFQRCSPSRIFSQFFELSTQAAFATAAFDTLRSLPIRERKTHKHKRICRIVPGLGGWQKCVYVFFWVIPYGGGKTHKQNPPQNLGTIP